MSVAAFWKIEIYSLLSGCGAGRTVAVDVTIVGQWY